MSYLKIDRPSMDNIHTLRTKDAWIGIMAEKARRERIAEEQKALNSIQDDVSSKTASTIEK